MSAYGVLARFYDMYSDADYNVLGRCYKRFLAKNGIKDGLLLDLCCGTGELAIYFLKRGYDVTGVDASAEMLSAAKDKAEKLCLSPLLIHQRLEKLDLYGTYDAAVCALDGFNHITSYNAFSSAVSRIALFLRPGGVLAFDVLTKRRFEKDFAKRSYTLEKNGVYAVWQNDYNPKICLNKAVFTIFEGQNNGLYRRFEDRVTERYYPPEYIRRILIHSGFKDVRIYDLSGKEKDSIFGGRLFFTARKV